MTDSPFPPKTLAEQMTLCHILLTQFKKDQERLLSQLNDWWAAERHGVAHPSNEIDITQTLSDLCRGRVGHSYPYS